MSLKERYALISPLIDIAIMLIQASFCFYVMYTLPKEQALLMVFVLVWVDMQKTFLRDELKNVRN